MKDAKITASPLVEKWEPLLEAKGAEPIQSTYRKYVTAQLLENTEKAKGEILAEDANVTAGIQNWDPVLMSLVRRMAPKLIAYDVCGLQPMTGPTGLVFALRAHYAATPPNGNPQGGPEAMGVDESDTAYSGTGTHSGTDPWAVGYSTGTGKATAAGETDAWNSMGVTIEKTMVEAKTRQLRADYSLEIAQDMRSVHGLDADAEMVNTLSSEIISEVNREIVRTLYSVAQVGAQWTTLPGTFDLNTDSDGRWSVERFKGLRFAIEMDANEIAIKSRRGKGNIVITTANVASALAMAGVLSFTPALQQTINLDVDAAGYTFAGTMGTFRVYVDPYTTQDGYCVGYKGQGATDAGVFYCPYVPLQLVRATNPVNFMPALGFKTRYGIVSNPFTDLTPNGNVYYRKAKILNLMP